MKKYLIKLCDENGKINFMIEVYAPNYDNASRLGNTLRYFLCRGYDYNKYVVEEVSV
jgi:hypothetical protein